MDLSHVQDRPNSYIIIANYPDNSVHFDKDYAKMIDVVDASSPQEAFDKFVEEHADDAYKAQRFYDDVYVMPNSAIQKFSIQTHYGDMARKWEFPNYGLLNQE